MHLFSMALNLSDINVLWTLYYITFRILALYRLIDLLVDSTCVMSWQLSDSCLWTNGAGLPASVQESWEQFKTGPLAEMNKRNTYELVQY